MLFSPNSSFDEKNSFSSSKGFPLSGKKYKPTAFSPDIFLQRYVP